MCCEGRTETPRRGGYILLLPGAALAALLLAPGGNANEAGRRPGETVVATTRAAAGDTGQPVRITLSAARITDARRAAIASRAEGSHR